MGPTFRQGDKSRTFFKGKWAVWIVSAALLASLNCAGLAAEPAPSPTPAPDVDDLARSLDTVSDNPQAAVPSSTPAKPATAEDQDLLSRSDSFPGSNPDGDAGPSTPPPVIKQPTVSAIDPLTQTNPAVRIVNVVSQQGLSNGESMFSGLGGVPNPLSARVLSPSFDRRLGFILGPAWVQPTLETGFVYRLQRGRAADGDYEDAYATITPRVVILLGMPDAGRVLALQYQGVISLGQTEGMGSYDQYFQLNGRYTFTKLSLGLSLQASQLTGADQDFSGDNANRFLFALSGNASYQYSEKTALDFTLTTPLRLYEQGNSSEGITSQTFLNYLYSPLTTLGVGFGLGTLVVEGRTQVFEQGLLRFGYAPTPFVSVDATLGYEFRQTDREDRSTPIFRLGVSWRPIDGTAFALSSERSVYNSAASNDANYTTTSISLTAAQRVGRFLEATTTFGFNDNSYESAGSASVYGRDERYFLFQAGLNARLNAHLRMFTNLNYSLLQSSGGAPKTSLNSAGQTASYGITAGDLHVFQATVQLGYDY